MNKILGWLTAGGMAILPMNAFAGQDSTSRVYTFQVELDPQGTLVSAALVRDAPDATTRQLQDELQNWVFNAAQRDGRPVPTKTWVRVTAVPATQGSIAQVLSATAGPAPEMLRKPVFPVAAQRRGDTGVVVLQLDMDDQGRVQAVDVHTKVGDVSRRMAESAIAAARNWTFRPEQVDGVPQAGRLLMPVCFVAEAATDTCQWIGPDAQAMGRDSLLALDPAVRLTNPVAFVDR